jgi:hypothetical protein
MWICYRAARTSDDMLTCCDAERQSPATPSRCSPGVLCVALSPSAPGQRHALCLTSGVPGQIHQFVVDFVTRDVISFRHETEDAS